MGERERQVSERLGERAGGGDVEVGASAVVTQIRDRLVRVPGLQRDGRDVVAPCGVARRHEQPARRPRPPRAQQLLALEVVEHQQHRSFETAQHGRDDLERRGAAVGELIEPADEQRS